MFSGFYRVLFSKRLVYEILLGLSRDPLRLERTVKPSAVRSKRRECWLSRQAGKSGVRGPVAYPRGAKLRRQIADPGQY